VGKNLCVDAGAGSGKTSVLVGRVLHLLDKRMATLDQIVAITFTDKAAAEMKDRLRREFHANASVEDPEAMNFWRDLERRAESARFTTIHSFCTGLLRENALALGADPDFSVLADAESFLLREEVLDSTLHELLNTGDEATMRAAAEMGLSKLGETLRKMVKRRATMERIGCEHPLHDAEALRTHWQGLIQLETKRRRLALAQNRKLKNLRKRLESFAGACADPEEGREVLRRELLISLGRILSGADLSAIDKELEYLANSKARGAKKAWPSDAVYDACKKAQDDLKAFAAEQIGKAPDEAVERAAAALTCDVHAVYLRVAKAFQEAKGKRPSQDFDDLILAASAMLRDNAAVRARTARGIKYLLIDEFQDTDDRQLLIAETLCGEDGGPELFIVGDVKQSIYRFRGAEVGVFKQARSDSDETIELARNFRSLPDVVQFVNDFFTQSGMLDAVEPTYRPLFAHREAVNEARVEFLLPALTDDASAETCRREEAKLIASRLVQMCSGAERVSVFDPILKTERPAHFGDVTMLFRSFSAVYLYEQVLRERGIPYTVVAGAGFYERQEVLDIRNVLSLVADPWDEMALLAYLRSPMAGLPDDALAHVCEGRSLSTAFADGRTPEGFAHAAAWTRARELVADLRENRERPLPDFLRYLLEQTGYEAVALSQFLGGQKALNLRKVVDLAEEFSRSRAGNLSAFVHYLDAISAESELREGEAALQSEDSGSVTLMTVHKSKGLEFSIVVVPDLGRQARASSSLLHLVLGMAVGVTGPEGDLQYPAIHDLIRRSDAEQDQAESGRVLYVAMTRARDWLLLSGARDPDKLGRSWLEEFDAVYDLTARGDGEELSGDGWRAVVRRGLAPLKAPQGDVTKDTSSDREALLRQVGPVPTTASRRTTFGVSEILDAMGDLRDPEDAGEPAENERGQGSSVAMMRGSLAHRMFEVWDFASRTAPDVEALLRWARAAPGLREELARTLRAAAERFTGSPLWERVVADPALRREQSFVFRLDDALLNGTMDLVLGDGTIVDYKTGKAKPELHARYERQLQLYAAALQQLTGKGAPSAALYYVDEGRVEDVSVSPECLGAVLADARAAIARIRAART
jgi:ATP-dependent helicase/nuclease subunit A